MPDNKNEGQVLSTAEEDLLVWQADRDLEDGQSIEAAEVVQPSGPKPPDEVAGEVAGIRKAENKRYEIAVSVLEKDEVKGLYGRPDDHGVKVKKGELVSEQAEEGFKVGDLAVYPGFGVTEVTELREMIIAGQKQKFFVLKIINTEHKVMVPLEMSKEVRMRLLIPREQVQEIFEILGNRPVDSDEIWVRRFRVYKEKMTTGSVFDLAEVFRDLSRTKVQKNILSYGESMLLKKAREMLAREMSLVLKCPETEVARQLDAAVCGCL